MHRHLLPVTLLLLVGCVVDPPDFGKETGGSSTPDSGDTESGDTDTDTDADSDSDADTDSGDPKDYNFDEAGDLAELESGESPRSLSLADESGDSNKDQEFYLILVNPATSDQTYGLRYILDSAVSARAREDRPARERSAYNPRKMEPIDFDPTGGAIVPRRDVLDTDDIGTTTDTFNVRIDMDDDDWRTKDATLWALGEHIAIWVDNEVAIDWDFECDGVIDQPHVRLAYGFDNCDLNTVADIFDYNIYPNVTELVGEPSDIDGDGRIDLFITPELNNITFSATDEEDQDSLLPSYAEPAVDLEDYDLKTNVGSDEREVIYAYAPDPVGFFHLGQQVPVSEYTSYALSAEVARSLVALVAYNQHNIVLEGSEVEEDWQNDVLGTLAADRCGFGAPFHKDAWDYLDSPYNYPLLAEGTKGSLDASAKGAQYLFGLWLWDWAATNTSDRAGFFKALLATEQVGLDAYEEALDTYATDTDMDFDTLVAQWQLSLVATGATDSSGAVLVTDAMFTAYSAAETLVSIPADRDSLFGANGYQRGVNINGLNYAWVDGDTLTPELEEGSDVRLGNTDVFHFDPAFEFSGWIDGNYGAQVVRLNGVPYDAAGIELQYAGDGFLGTVVRWNDPTADDYAVENIYGATDAQSVALPSLPVDGTTIYGLGQIAGADTVIVKLADGDTESLDVVDTDRWLLDLRDHVAGESVRVEIWLDRRFDADGDSEPSNPWIAVAPLEYVPEPTVAGTHSNALCTDAISFEFPESVIEHLYYQVFLSGTMGSEQEVEDACGVPEGTLPTCDLDFDRDGVLDESEPMPETFYDQVLVQQCTSFGGSLPSGTAPYSTTWLDTDELDEDEDFTFDRSLNTGGLAGVEGEEGFLDVTLVGGEQYLVVVGAGEDEGVYELSLRQINE
ncbi:hypothetical protein LBMAG42_06250 [Deltaproteobacteria bacterium]|nr:hypothetical protein LBMAG42_06250 [Deltaproteobacteria bacterium]